ncbi:GGDEF domain-containing protein [Novosphingobium album (ex Liu et al. 2023)]|uniref:diguanylate cyclase n=1 Tax=Novosphingobium album (ex Liu et al. 2023) TaxID=3031130 RepID=A0ABT5WVK5_9SPHN|nr:GGDEF domain-containing protein [Novosphingobium album (ex Liu et al. 2023)]MDE8653934.1 GGDEF domain-containing protein [Novosphingobium album (ex Liu et al. 2023)]
MRFYQATRFLFPRSLERRIAFVCLAATALPLIACLAYQAATGTWNAAILGVLALATLLGAGLALATILGLLSPVARAAAMLQSIQDGKRVGAIPVGGEDVVGRLFRGVAIAANQADGEAGQLSTADERDDLTGLRNRRGFFIDAARVLTGEYNAVLALIEIDHFEAILETYGDMTGDSLLRAFAGRLAMGTRRTDVSARWASTQFAVLLIHTTLEDARAIMERLRVSVTQTDPLFVGNSPVTFSCGLAPVRDQVLIGAAISRADAALHIAQYEGRNRVEAAS